MISDDNNLYENRDEIKEKKYILTKDNVSYEIEVNEISNIIHIKYKNYEISLTFDEISKIINISINSKDEVYKYIINIFEQNEVIIKDIIDNEKIRLIFKLHDSINHQESEIEIDLINNEINKDFIITQLINKCNKLENENISLKTIKGEDKKGINQEIFKDKNKNELENNQEKIIKKENDTGETNNNLNINKSEKENKEIINNNIERTINISITNNDKYINKEENNLKNNVISNEKIKIVELGLLNEITENSFCSNIEDNTFYIFNSFQNNILYLIYSTKAKSIICYKFSEKKIIKEIKDPHEGEYITNYRHSIYNNLDIIMSISLSNNMLKIWEFPNFECILTIKKVNEKGNLYSACFLNKDIINIHERNNYIITSSAGSNDPIKIYDFNGDIVQKFEQQSEEDVYFIDSYFDIKLKKYFIITGNYNYTKSYDFYETKLYKKYYNSSEDNYGSHCSCIINVNKNNENEVVKLIDLCYGSDIIQIWNFHTGELISKITTDGIGFVSCCLWNNNYIYVASKDRTIKLIDLSKKEVVQNLKGHKNWISCVRKIKHHEYGECLVSQGDLNDQIKLWINKSLIK